MIPRLAMQKHKWKWSLNGRESVLFMLAHLDCAWIDTPVSLEMVPDYHRGTWLCKALTIKLFCLQQGVNLAPPAMSPRLYKAMMSFSATT